MATSAAKAAEDLGAFRGRFGFLQGGPRKGHCFRVVLKFREPNSSAAEAAIEQMIFTVRGKPRPLKARGNKPLAVVDGTDEAALHTRD
jgi:hypothetical protein